MRNDILRINIKGKWFDMILAGIKKEEYRAVKKHWIKRLLQLERGDGFVDDIDYQNFYYYIKNTEDPSFEVFDAGYGYKEFKFVEFINGMSKTARRLTLQFKGIEIKKPVKEWSDGEFEDEYLFAIKLGSEISRKNI